MEPKAFKILNDRIELVGISLEKSQRGDSTFETSISFYGEIENETGHEEWKAYDSAGKQYDVITMGVSSLENTLTDHWREGYISMGDRNSQQPY
ncbi:hypothetical protein [Paenibacillus sp. lzh-N1]|uniref:hypothetical protein n=1 Tax=Paenibacillus sp. lzh-N1 TaxID=2069255 RepID=UPI001F16BF31|nr:hypothetical protein [Paenibacillus sp. lzh-N1]